jgi:hypothetical protein
MDKGERIMPVPEGVISTSEGPVDPEAPVELVEEELPVEEELDQA